MIPRQNSKQTSTKLRSKRNLVAPRVRGRPSTGCAQVGREPHHDCRGGAVLRDRSFEGLERLREVRSFEDRDRLCEVRSVEDPGRLCEVRSVEGLDRLHEDSLLEDPGRHEAGS